jgi:hypothetical protein
VLVLLVLGGCIAIGPTRIGLMPPMAPIGSSRDADPTRVPSQTNQPGGPESGDEGETPTDPVTIGPISGAVTGTSFLLHYLTGMRTFLGVYGTFDENRLVAPPPPPPPPRRPGT